MKKVILTKGLPGSGKTSWTKNLPLGRYKRINKDDLRAMLDHSNHSKDNEKFVIKVRDMLILAALEEGKHVVVDDTNLAPKHFEHIKQLVKGKAEVEIEDFTCVPVQACIEHDLKRLNSVGKDVIMQMYNQFLKPKPPVIEYNFDIPDAIICDLDGTLALLNGRNPYDASTCHKDLCNPAVRVILNSQKRTSIILVSGREEKYRHQTYIFLEDNRVEFDELFMRPTGDSRKDSVVKREIYENEIKGKYNIGFVLDDRNQVVEMWRELGLTCLQVAEGDF